MTKQIYLLCFVTVLLIQSGCQRMPQGYFYLDAVRNRDAGVYKKTDIYSYHWLADEPDVGYTDWSGGRLYLQDEPTWRAIWTHDDRNYIVLMRRSGGSLGVSEPLDIDVFDTDFNFVRSGVANGPVSCEPYALIMAKMDTDRIPESIRNQWRLCVAFAGHPIDTTKPIHIDNYDNSNDFDNSAILELVEWDDEKLEIKWGTGEIGELRSIEMKSAEPGLEITKDGWVVVPEFPDNGL